MRNDFVALILSHGRADRVITHKNLRKQGYTGDICVIVDDEDKELEAYKRKFGDELYVFSKKDYEGKFDVGDNFKNRRGVVYARNACFDIARSLGKQYFIELDDDYTQFIYKFNKDYDYQNTQIKSLDKVFELMVEFLAGTNAVTVAMAQGGDFIGGQYGKWASSIHLRRKAMNTFVCDVDRPFEFMGRINEDVVAYVVHGMRGILFLTINALVMIQVQTQTNEGGMTELYLDEGTYVKSFYSVMFAPSCVKVSVLYSKKSRIHHQISWNNAVPKMLREEYAKG